jgi:selenocysteine lyase/cysteine desulfurase
MDCDGVSEELYDRGKIIALSGELGSRLMLRRMGVTAAVRTSVHCFNDANDLEVLRRVLKELSTKNAR